MIIIDEFERMHNVTGGVNGCYDDPENPDMFIIKTDDGISKIPKSILNHLDKIKELYKND